MAYTKIFLWDQKCESKCESHSLFCIKGKPNKFCLSTLLSEFFFTSFTAPYWPLFFLTNIEGWMPSRFFEEKICQKTMPYECVRNCNYFPCERKIMIMIQFFFCFPDLLIQKICISKWGQKLTKIASKLEIFKFLILSIDEVVE